MSHETPTPTNLLDTVLNSLSITTGVKDIHPGAVTVLEAAQTLRDMLINHPLLYIDEARKRLQGMSNRIALPGDRVLVLFDDDQWMPCRVQHTSTAPRDQPVRFTLIGYTVTVEMQSARWTHIPLIKIPAPYDIVEVLITDGVSRVWKRRAVDNSGRTAFQVEVGDQTYLLGDHGKTWRHYDPDRQSD
jgi:hypothetical protein